MQAKLKFGVATAALLMLTPAAFAQTADPAGDASTQARLQAGAAVDGEISPSADSDWYRLSVEQGQRYALTLEGVAGADGAALDPTLAVYDAQGNQLAFNDDSEGSLNSALTYTPSQSGDVFVEARAFLDEATGAYRLNVTASAAPSDDIGNDANTRARAASGRSSPGNIEYEGDVDWFRLNARSNQSYRVTVTGGEGEGQLRDPVLRVIGQDGVELASSDDSDGSLNPALDWTPQAGGAVFFEVSGYAGSNTGRYALNVNASAAPSDDLAANARTRGRIAPGGSNSSQLDFAGDRDWYRVRLQGGQSYSFILNSGGDGGLDPVVKVYDSAGTELAMDDDGGEGLNSYLEFVAPTTGNYYVEARGFSDDATGAYTLTARNGDIPADTTTEISLSPDGDFREGVLAPSGDRDWYKIALAAGQGVRIGMTSSDGGEPLGDPLLAIHGPDGAELVRDDDSGEGLNAWLEFVAPSEGTYFVAAQSFLEDGAGRYLLNITAGEIGANAEGAEYLAANSEGRTSTISNAEDVDWFGITLVEGRPYRFNLNSMEPDALSDPLLTLFDAEGNQVAVDDDGGAGTNAYLSFTSPTGGMYYAAVSGFGGMTGRYYLGVVDTDVPGSAATDEYLDAASDDRTSHIEIAGDMDAYRVELEAGARYVIDVRGSGEAPLADPFLAVIDMNGTRVDSDDDSGDGRDARLRFSSAEGGSYLLQVSGLGGAIGGYTISIVRQQ
jgi:hypothetical protein